MTELPVVRSEGDAHHDEISRPDIYLLGDPCITADSDDLLGAHHLQAAHDLHYLT